MNEELEKVSTEEQKEETGKSTAEKTYTQSEVDKIVGGRLAREKDKISRLKEENENLKSNSKVAGAISKILAEKGEINGNTLEEQALNLGEFYDMSKDEVKNIIKSIETEDLTDKEAIESIKAQLFIERADEDEISEEYERILKIPPSKRTVKDRELFKKIEPKAIRAKIDADKKWYESEYSGNFDELIKSDEFKDFIDGTNMDISTAVRKYAKLKGQKIPPSTGSAKDYGSTEQKKTFTSEELDKLTDKDLSNPKILEMAMKSLQQL